VGFLVRIRAGPEGASGRMTMIWPFKRITIFEASPHGDAIQDLEWPELHPIGGSETASIRMAAALRHMGFEVELLTRPEKLAGHDCDVFIASRVWRHFQEGVRPGKLNYLWCHDDANAHAKTAFKDPAVSGRVLSQVTGMVFISYYQAHGWIDAFKIPANKIVMSTNGVPYERFNVDESQLAGRPRRAFYSSTPFRGLNLLLEAWPLIRQNVPGAELHVFSSMKVYHDEELPVFQELYRKATTLPGVVYHGSVGQAALREAITQCRVLAYPCTFAETSCITAMEAMAAGCGVAAPSIGALPETAWQNPIVPAGPQWYQQWCVEVARLLVDNAYYAHVARQNRAIARHYDWENVATRVLYRFRTDWMAHKG
jgi:glycosyltransferase involved in cell wall biosynthesis